jgi:small-conductance mechanosensitive channel
MPNPFPFLFRAGHFSFLNNSLEEWAAALAVALVTSIAMLAVRALVLRRIETLSNTRGRRLSDLVSAKRPDDFLVAMLSRTYVVAILVFGLYFGSTFLDLAPKRELLVGRIAVGTLLIQMAIWGDTGLRAWRDQYRNNRSADTQRRASSGVLTFISRLALWVIVTLMVLDNFGVNITTLVASLGIGGVAVALATQNILGDLFASLSIMLDKPFEVDDFIIVGDVLGWVEHIGLKTTRVRGLGGEQVVFSNGELLKSRIHNHKRMQTRRVAFVLRVAYGTSQDKLCRIPRIVREVVTSKPNIDFERAHFFMWGDWSLNYEVVYHYRSPDYLLHMDAQQDIFLEIYRRFEEEGIQFAQPVSVLHLADPALSKAMRSADPGMPSQGPSFH